MFYLKHIFPILILFSAIIFPQKNKVLILNAECAVHPPLADYISSGIKRASEIDAECLIIKLNTPGGLLTSTRNIVQEFLQSEIPIVVYVYPSGSQAASAGVFITLAANIAAMAPGTNIGAAHPVAMQGSMDTVMSAKATNDASAFIRSISEKRKRNVEWSEEAVRKSISITEKEAVELNVINFIADDINELIERIDKMEVETSKGKKIIDTQDYEIVEFKMSISQKFFSIISDPNIVYILLMIGIYGIFFELYNPGTIFPGVLGAICLILSFYAMNTLPINYAGLALIFLSIILFILEIKIISHGLLTIGGIISLLLGSMMLVDPESILETMEISMELIIFIIVLTTLFFLVIITLGIKAQKRKPVTGVEGLIGEKGFAVSDLNPHGEIRVHGEYWKAEAVGSYITNGEEIVVLEMENLKLKVKKAVESF
jgi:membrane-bound serine protease (ClpP class)